MSSKSPEQWQRKQDMFALIDSYEPAHIARALEMLEGDKGLFQAAKHRYYPLLRSIDAHLGAGFEILYTVASCLATGEPTAFLGKFVAHYAELGATEIVLKTLKRFPECVFEISNIALLNMVLDAYPEIACLVEKIDFATKPQALHRPPANASMELLRHLEVSHEQQLLALASHFAVMPLLETLVAVGSRLATLPDECADLQSLITCTLDQNQFEDVPSVLADLPHLGLLSLRNNQIARFPKELSRFPALQHLSLAGNCIERIEASDLADTGLIVLDLQGNRLTADTLAFGESSTGLLSLNLSHNPLEAFPLSLLQLEGLQKLDMKACGITELPASVAHLDRLRALSLVNNPLQALPATVVGMKALEVLDLRGTQISTLPEGIMEMSQLTCLALNARYIRPDSALATQLKASLPTCLLLVV
jgi:Leucine-rich repeat (LRR) protein